MPGHNARRRTLLFSAIVGLCAIVACRTTSRPPPPASSAEPGLPSSRPPPPSPLSSGARIEDERNTISVFRAVAPSTVFVTQTRVVVDFLGDEQEVAAGSGSGFVWDDAGHIVTNYHVVQGARSLRVTFQDQKTFDAKLVGVEPRKDIAVLRVDVPRDLLKPVIVGQHANLDVGQKAIAIGNPFGLESYTDNGSHQRPRSSGSRRRRGHDPRHDSDGRRHQSGQQRRSTPGFVGDAHRYEHDDLQQERSLCGYRVCGAGDHDRPHRAADHRQGARRAAWLRD